MNSDRSAKEKTGVNVQQSASSSFLVRVRRETGQDNEVRFYLRNLKTGEERYLGDAERLGELLTTGLPRDKREQTGHRNTA